jgi:hypothetical protein
MAISGLKDLCLPSNEPPKKVQIKIPANRKTGDGIRFLIKD